MPKTISDVTDDTLLEIIQFLDATSIIRFLNTSKQYWNLKQKPIVNDRIQPFQMYIKYEQWNKGLIEATNKNNFPQIVFFVDKGALVNQALSTAAFHGNLRVIQYLFQHGATAWDAGIAGAARGNHIHIIEYFEKEILKNENASPTIREHAFVDALAQACGAGHVDMVKYLIAKMKITKETSWKLPTRPAVASGNRELLNLFEELGATNNTIDAFLGAAEGGHLDLLERFWHGRTSELPRTFSLACYRGHKPVIEWIQDSGYRNPEEGLEFSAMAGHFGLVEYFIDQGAKDWDTALKSAAEGGHLDLVNYFLEKGAKDVEGAMQSACHSDHREIIELMIEKGAKDWNGGLAAANMFFQKQLERFFEKKGATPTKSIFVSLFGAK